MEYHISFFFILAFPGKIYKDNQFRQGQPFWVSQVPFMLRYSKTFYREWCHIMVGAIGRVGPLVDILKVGAPKVGAPKG